MLHSISTLLITLLLLIAQPAIAQSLSQLQFGPKKEQQGNRIDGIAAIVGNDVITLQELQQVGNSREGFERLVMQKLLLQAARDHNIVIGDTALNIALDEARSKNHPIPREQLRTNLMIQKLQQQVANSLVDISDADIANALAQQLQQTDAKLQLVDILVRVPESADTKTLRRAQEKTQRILTALKTRDAQAVAQAHQVIYNDLGWVALSAIPPSFSSALIDAPINEFLPPIIDRDGIHLLKIIARQAQTTSETGRTQTRVSHILIKDKDNPTAKQTIKAIYQQLHSGADFAALAEQYSQDDGSAARGGSLDWAYPGQMVPDFEIVMNQTGIGQISQPFKSPFGYHILKVHERRQAQRNSREALEQRARRQIFQKRAREEWESWLVRLRDEAYIKVLQ